MKSLIVGNGVNIQFAGMEYFNNQILKRAIDNLDTGNFNEKIYPKELGGYIIQLLLLSKELLSGSKDNLVLTTYEKKTLPAFKQRNKKAIQLMDYSSIGLEDYFFLHHMFCRDNKIFNPELYLITKGLERLFLDSIYNDGRINDVNKSFSNKFISWLNEFDQVFTTNYDTNIDQVLNKPVYHLHGSFSKLSDVYNPESFRNELELDEYDFVEGYNHLYCDAIFDFSGYGKDFVGLQAERTNSVLEKLAKAVKNGELKEQKNEIGSWKNSDNEIWKNFHKAIYTKVDKPEMEFEDHYHFGDFSSLKGELTFLGLSPYNDEHITEMVRKNENITRIKYYYYSPEESREIDKCFPHKKIEKIKVIKFWKRF